MDPDPWLSARTFAELCELGARFVEGEIASFPGWGSTATDEETDVVAAELAAINRGGLLTVASQRGASDRRGSDGRIERRRAFVTGFVAPTRADALAGLEPAGLHVSAYGALETAGVEIPVGERAGEAFLVAGGAAGPAELELFRDRVQRSALEALGRARYVWVVDPEWGRDDRLWSTLADVLATPY